jgi:uncharacterized protein (DUF1800 family)
MKSLHFLSVWPQHFPADHGQTLLKGLKGKLISALCALALSGMFLIALPSLAQAQANGRAFTGDFDGDRKADLAFWNYAELTWYIANSSDGTIRSQAWGSPNPPYNDVPVLKDYDGDRKTDLAIWRPSEGTWYILNSSNGATRTQAWGAGYAPYSDIPLPADYDGDGKADIAIWRPSEGTWYILNSSNGATRTQAWGAGYAPYNDIPVPADYDGDGKTDLAIWRADGSWWILNSSNGSTTTKLLGAPGDKPVVADYDGDGKADIAVWRGSNSQWKILRSSDGQTQTISWGAGYAPYNDVPVPADYDNDGKVDVAIWRPAEGNWYIINSSNGGTTVQALPTMTPGDAVRLLEQATFGPTAALITHTRSVGAVGFLNEQFAAAASTYPNFSYYPPTSPPECSYDSASPTGPASICNRDNYSLFQVQLRFFQNAMTGQDQLRQRVAFALSQIMVISGNEINQSYAMAQYQQLLRNSAFGNFRQLLYDVTLSPAMGRYLDMVNNDKPDPARGTEPNENYARELLQLFSIGEVKLNLDGTPQLDGMGNPIPAYDQDVVEGFAHVFTGWTYPTLPNGTPIRHNPTYYTGPMVVWPSNHDTGAKELLNNVVLQAGQTADKDLNDAINNLFNHPNVGPFIGRQLIQHLVTSNPSPAYIARVATAFNNNGQGVRGDMKAVIKAILLDPEARGDVKTDVNYGHQREPVLFVLNALRALNGQSDGVYLRGQVSKMGQNLFYSPSVFNYYPPDYNVPGTTIFGPEFAIMNTASAFSRTNFINSLVYTTLIAADPTVTGATGTSLNLASLQALAGNPTQMVELLNTNMLHGTMSTQMKNAIVTAVQAVAATDTLGRARAAAYLVATSSQYQVER